MDNRQVAPSSKANESRDKTKKFSGGQAPTKIYLYNFDKIVEKITCDNNDLESVLHEWLPIMSNVHYFAHRTMQHMNNNIKKNKKYS